MESFDRRMALDVIADAFTDVDTQHGRGRASGLCAAFYLCGLISEEEWQVLLERIPVEFNCIRTSETRDTFTKH